MNVVTTLYEANLKDVGNLKWSYVNVTQNVLNYDSVNLLNRPVSMTTLIKVLRLTHLILIMRWEIIYWAMMSSY